MLLSSLMIFFFIIFDVSSDPCWVLASPPFKHKPAVGKRSQRIPYCGNGVIGVIRVDIVAIWLWWWRTGSKWRHLQNHLHGKVPASPTLVLGMRASFEPTFCPEIKGWSSPRTFSQWRLMIFLSLVRSKVLIIHQSKPYFPSSKLYWIITQWMPSNVHPADDIHPSQHLESCLGLPVLVSNAHV